MKKLTKSAKIVLVSVISAICVLGIVLGCVFAMRGKNPSDPNNPNSPNNQWNSLLQNFANAINKNNFDKNDVGFIFKNEDYVLSNGSLLDLEQASKIEKNYVIYGDEIYIKKDSIFINILDLDIFSSFTKLKIEDKKDTYLVISYLKSGSNYFAVVDFTNANDVVILNEYKDVEAIVLYEKLYYVINKDDENLHITISTYKKDSSVTYDWLYADYPTDYVDLEENIYYGDDLYYFVINKVCYFGFYNNGSVVSSKYDIDNNERIFWYSGEHIIYSVNENNNGKICVYNVDNILSPAYIDVESSDFYVAGIENSEYFYLYEIINNSGIMKYYDKNGNVILTYNAKSYRDTILYLNKNILLQESGIYSVDKNRNFSQILDFSQINFDETLNEEHSNFIVTSNAIINNTFIITDKSNNYILDMNGNLVFDDNFESLYQYENGIYFGMLNNQVYMLDTNLKTSTIIENYADEKNSIFFGSGYYIIDTSNSQGEDYSYELYDFNGKKIKQFSKLNVTTYGNSTIYEIEQKDNERYNVYLNRQIFEINEVESFDDTSVKTYSKINEVSPYSDVSYSGAPDWEAGMTITVQAGEYYYPKSGTLKSEWWTYIVVGIMKSLSFSFSYNYSSGTASLSGKDNCTASFKSSSYSSGVKLSFSAKASSNGAGCAGISASGSNMKDAKVWVSIYSKSNYLSTYYNKDQKISEYPYTYSYNRYKGDYWPVLSTSDCMGATLKGYYYSSNSSYLNYTLNDIKSFTPDYTSYTNLEIPSYCFENSYLKNFYLFAIYKPNTYTINFNSNKPSNSSYSPSPSEPISSIPATYEEDVTLPSSTYSLTGWSFQGWSTSSTASSASYTAGQTLSTPNFTTTNKGTVTLYAVWSAKKYTIKLSGGGGTISNLAVASGSSGLTLSGTTFTATFDQLGKFSFNAQRTGYLFNGWSISNNYNYTNETYTTDLSSISNGTYKNTKNSINLITQVQNLSAYSTAMTLTATWTPITYKVQISSNGGTTSSYGTNYGATVNSTVFTLTFGSTASFYNSIYRTGYMFTGYTASSGYLYSERTYSQSYTNVDESTTPIKITSYALNLTYYRGATVTLTASWSAIKYFIEYNSNKPSIASSTVQGTVSDTTMYYDSTSYSLATNKFTLTGWTFQGWSQNSSATTPTYNSGAKPSRLNATTKRNSTVVMYAIWKQNTYTITFNGNGGTVSGFSAISGLTMPSTASFKATYDQQGVFTNLAIRTGYMFTGWTVSTGLGSANATPNSAYSNFDDYYNANTNSASNISVKTTILNLTSTNNGTVILSAVWSPISYYIKLESGASDAYVSSLANVSNTVLSGSLFRVSYNTTGVISNKIKRDGYTFNGWTNSGAGTVTPSYTTIDDTTTAISVQTTVNNLTYIHNKTITLTARWNAISYYIQLVGNGGTISGLANVSNLPLSGSKFQATYDLEGVLSANIVRAGYKFTDFKNTSSKGTVSSVPYNSSYSTFAGYYLSNPQTQSNIQVKTTAKNLTTTRGATVELTAEWSAISYTLHYNGNKPSGSTYSPTGSTSNSYATYDKTVTFSVNGFSIIGWTALGWSDTASDTTAKFISGGTADKNFTTIDGGTVEIYSIWRKNNYTINYKMNGGFKSSSKTYTTNAQFDTVFFVDTLERIGYTFTSYTISNMSTNNTKLIGQSNPPTNSLGESVTTYENMRTSGYYKNLTSEDNGVVYFEAFWTPNKYSLSYNFSGGEGNGVYPTTATYDISFPVSAPKRLGYTFAGWNITGMDTICTHYYGDKTTTSATINQTLATNFKNLRATDGTVTFTATWNANVYKISYDYANGGEGSGLSYPKTMTYDSWSTIDNPVRTGYTFVSWSVSGMSKTCIHYYGQSSSSYKTTESQNLSIEDISIVAFKNLHSETDAVVTFTANWVANTYNIIYVLNQKGLEGGKLDIIKSSIKYDEILPVNAPNAYPFGYHFNGWILSSMSTDCQHYYGASSTNVSNETGMVETFHAGAKDKYFKNLHSTNGATVVLTADWEANSYNLKYILTDNRGGDGHFNSSNPAPTTARYDEQFTIPTPIRTGYTFIGWSFAGLADFGDNGKAITHYYSSENVPFYSTNGSYAVDGNMNAIIKSGTFKNLHYQTDATVTLTASWRANEYTVTYHYLDGDYNTSLLTDSTINTYTTVGGSWKTKSQSVVYDAMFTTMKMAKSDADTTGVVIPANIKIIYWIFYASPVESNHRFATNDENQNPIPEHSYYLGVGTEYVYSSYELFNNYPLFGADVHAYAIYGFTDITLKFMGGKSKIDFNNMAGYTLKYETGTKISRDVVLPTSLDSQPVLGYMISANIFSEGELNIGSISNDYLNGVYYKASAGATIKWARPSSDAFDPENPTFYLYAIYDTSIKSFYTPQVYSGSTWKAIGLNTVGMFTAGKTYSITISGLESVSQYDYKNIKLSSYVNSSDSDSSVCAFDGIYAHKGQTSESVVNVSNFSAVVPNSTTLTVTFTADSNTKNFSLYLFYGADKDINIDDYLKDLRIVIQEVNS